MTFDQLILLQVFIFFLLQFSQRVCTLQNLKLIN